jgi:hypothetical protein
MTNGLMPCDIADTEGNLPTLWSDKELLEIVAGVSLKPLEAKALHVFGILLQNFEATGHLLSFAIFENEVFKGWRVAANYYLQAFLLACTSIELLAYCKNGRENLLKDQNDALKSGLQVVGLDPVVTNHGTFGANELIALRNLAAHGQGVASVGGQPQPVFLSVELLDSFPKKMMDAFDEYYRLIFKGQNNRWRRNLANSGVIPVHYHPDKSGCAFYTPILYAYQHMIEMAILPSQTLKNIDWQVYIPNQDEKVENRRKRKAARRISRDGTNTPIEIKRERKTGLAAALPGNQQSPLARTHPVCVAQGAGADVRSDW